MNDHFKRLKAKFAGELSFGDNSATSNNSDTLIFKYDDSITISHSLQALDPTNPHALKLAERNIRFIETVAPDFKNVEEWIKKSCIEAANTPKDVVKIEEKINSNLRLVCRYDKNVSVLDFSIEKIGSR